MLVKLNFCGDQNLSICVLEIYQNLTDLNFKGLLKFNIPKKPPYSAEIFFKKA